MASNVVEAENDSSSLGPVKGGLGTSRLPISLLIALGGVLMIVGGYLLQTGVWAAILPVWGTACILVGVSVYVFVRWTQR